MFSRIGQSWRKLRTTFRQDRIMSLWEAKKYDKLAGLFKKPNDYHSFKINQYSFIHFLINEKDKQAIQVLLSKVPFKTQVIEDDDNPMTILPICYAFLEGDNDIVKIIEKQGGSLNKLNRSAQNVLHLAAIYKRQEAFKNAMAQNINFNLQDEFGNTPFHYAARAGSPEMTNTMIVAKAKKLQNKIYQYPVHMAVESGNLETFQLLKNDVLGTYPKYHPIHSGGRSGNPQMMRSILKIKPASLNFKDHHGLTALHHAVIVEDIEMVRNLLKEPGLLINETDQYGNSALHLAVMNQNIELSQMLIEAKADLDLINQDNLSPADYGITSRNKEIHSLLLKWRDRSKKVDEWSSAKY